MKAAVFASLLLLTSMTAPLATAESGDDDEDERDVLNKALSILDCVVHTQQMSSLRVDTAAVRPVDITFPSGAWDPQETIFIDEYNKVVKFRLPIDPSEILLLNPAAVLPDEPDKRYHTKVVVSLQEYVNCIMEQASP